MENIYISYLNSDIIEPLKNIIVNAYLIVNYVRPMFYDNLKYLNKDKNTVSYTIPEDLLRLFNESGLKYYFVLNKSFNTDFYLMRINSNIDFSNINSNIYRGEILGYIEPHTREQYLKRERKVFLYRYGLNFMYSYSDNTLNLKNIWTECITSLKYDDYQIRYLYNNIKVNLSKLNLFTFLKIHDTSTRKKLILYSK